MIPAIPRGETLRRAAALLLAATFTAWTRSAEACSVCLSATDETREAYYVTTVLMMLLPFVLLGALVYWLRKAAGRGEEVRQAPGWGVDCSPTIQPGRERE
jgi:hypothetical protein